MSRGPGKVERALVGVLSDEWRTMRDLAARVTGAEPPSRAAVESVRRASRRLADRGQVELDYLDTGYPTEYPGREHRPGVWSDLGDGRNAYAPGHRPAAPCWELVARAKR